MANDYTAEVLRYLRRKDSSGFEPITWLGSEQRFVGALRNSGVNNLEEQYVLGTDTYTVSYTDSEGNDVIEKSYCVTPSGSLDGVTNYYKVITTIYNDGDPDAEYKFDGEALEFKNTSNDVTFHEAAVRVANDLDNLKVTSARGTYYIHIIGRAKEPITGLIFDIDRTFTNRPQ